MIRRTSSFLSLSASIAFTSLLFPGAYASAQEPAAAQESKPEAIPEALLQRALELHQSGQLEAAVAAYLEVLKLAPSAALVRSNLGAAYAGLGRYDEAIVEYRRAIVGADEPSIRQNLALALQKAGRLTEAAEEATRLVAADPANAKAVLLLADTRLRLGQNAAVVELLKPLAAAVPGDKTIAFLLGSALLNLNQTQEAMAVMNRVFAEDSPEAHVLLGSMHLQHHEQDEALRELSKAQAVNPKLPLLNFLYGRALMEKSDWAGAAAAFRRELEIDPNHFEANLMLGNLLREEGNHEEAVHQLERALRLRPGDLTVKFSLGASLVALGRLEEARPLLEDVAAAVPSHLPTHMQLAILYVRLGRKEDAARERSVAARLSREADERGVEGGRERVNEIIGKVPSPEKQ
jgi:tetratricopeptide (TPR) repeat protein